VLGNIDMGSLTQFYLRYWRWIY